VGLVPRTPRLVARRRALAAGRLVPDREVVGLQMRGSARVAAYLRQRDARPDPTVSATRAWRQRAGASAAIGWCCLILAVVVGGRHLVTGGIPRVGQFLPFDPGPRHLVRAYANGWNPQGMGASGPTPTGLGLVALASVVTLFHMGLLQTLAVVGAIVLGAAGMWRVSSAFSITRSRLVCTVVYAAVPLWNQLISTGRWSALAVSAALPWSVDVVRRAGGLMPGPADEDGERTAPFGARRSVRLVATGALVTGIATAFAPSYLLIVAVVVVGMGAATLVTGAPALAAARLVVVGLLGAAVGALLNLPWLSTLAGDGWSAFVGPRPPGDRGYSVIELATFDIGNARGVVLSLALYLPVLGAVLVGRGWRFGWAVRAAVLVIGFAWLAALDDRGALPVRLPEPGIVLAPVAVGLAIAAGCVVASFELDVRGGSFGWRQPLSLLSILAVAVGVVPAAIGLTTGRWDAPTTTMMDLLESRLPEPADAGDYHILWVGDQRVLPATAQPYRPGVGYAITTDRELHAADGFPSGPGEAHDQITSALDAVATGTTTRAGRLLAPFSVRFVIVPVVDGAVSNEDHPVPVPAGLLDALGDQLDLAQLYSPPNFQVYENRAWIPMRSILTPEGAAASTSAGAESLAVADVSGATPVMIGADQLRAGVAQLPAGTLHVAVPFDRRWHLQVDGRDVPGRPAFGSTLAFDVTTPGTAHLTYATPGGVRAGLLVQLAGWLVVLVAASHIRLRRPRGRWHPSETVAAPVFTLGPPGDAAPALAPSEPVADVHEPAAGPAAEAVDRTAAHDDPLVPAPVQDLPR
jgi:hypothetical protein